MTGARMRAGEVATGVALVTRLVGAQFPRWADRPIVSVPSAGTGNALYLLGDDLVARLPRITSATAQAAREE